MIIVGFFRFFAGGVAFALALTWLASVAVSAAMVQDVRIGKHPDRTRIVLDITEPVAFQLYRSFRQLFLARFNV